MSKQTKLEQEGSVEQGYARPTYQEEEPAHHQHESSPLNDPVHYEQSHYQHSSPYEGGNMGQYQHSPYDASQYPSNQYHTSPPTQFSPMPTPQHVMPHPDQVHYNNNPNF